MRWLRRCLSWAKGLLVRERIALEYWIRENQLKKPIEERQIVFVNKEDRKTLEGFAALCHERVLDRDVSFSLEKRIQLYDRWLSSKQSCLMAVTDAGHRLIGASIVLPLTADGYEQFCFHGLDALDIESHHIVHPASNDLCRYLLVDMLATSKDMIKRLSRPEREKLRGIGFRAVLYHIAIFFDPDRQPPVIMCSTENKPLVQLLTELKFDDKCKQAGKTAIYRADLSRLDFYPRNVRKAYSLILALARHYKKTAQRERDKKSRVELRRK